MSEEQTVNQKTVRRLRQFTEQLENEEQEDINLSLIEAAKICLFILGAFGGLVLFFVGSTILMAWSMETLLP